jgi:hypothetical protein
MAAAVHPPPAAEARLTARAAGVVADAAGFPGRWSAAGRKHRAAFVLFALALLIAAARLHTFHEPLERDLTTYALIGRGLLEGRALYADLWDHKPPAVHLTYAAAVAVAGCGPGALYLLSVAAAVATLLGVYRAAAAICGGPASGLWAAGFWALLSGDLDLQANQPNTEVFLNAALVWAFALLLAADRGGAAAARRAAAVRRVLLVGGLLALASLYKQVALATAALFWCAHIACAAARTGRRRAFGEALGMAAVVAAAWAATAAVFRATGTYDAFVEAVFTYNRQYAGSLGQNLAALFRVPVVLPDGLGFAAPLAWLALFGAAAAAVPWRAGGAADGGSSASRVRRGALLAAFAAGTLIAVVLPGQFHPHYYQLYLPPLAIAAGAGVGALARRAGPRGGVLATTAGALAVLLLVQHQLPFYRLPPEDWSRRKYGETFVESETVARTVRGLLGPGETLFEWGAETGLYFYSGRSPASGVFYAYPLLTPPSPSRRLDARVIRDLDAAPPELFVIHTAAVYGRRPGASYPVLDWFARRYRPLPGRERQGSYLFYARRGGALEARASRVAIARAAVSPGSGRRRP